MIGRNKSHGRGNDPAIFQPQSFYGQMQGCFSFHAVKNLATGDGGMITTNDKDVYDRLLKLRWCGLSKDTWNRNTDNQYSWHYDVSELGYKYHMNDIAASMGLVQLARLDKMNAARQHVAELYNQAFGNIKEIEIPVKKDYMTKPAYHNYVIKCKFRNELNLYLKSFGISTGVHYIPNNHYDMYKSYGGKTPVSDAVWQNLLTLPLYPDLAMIDVVKIIEKVTKFF